MRFKEKDLRPMGRPAAGNKAIALKRGDEVVGMDVISAKPAEGVDGKPRERLVLAVMENGYGKRTVLADFRHSGRGNQGVIAIAASERNGKVVAARLVKDEDEIMLITTGGVLIRTRVREIRELGRATQGVTLIALDDGEKLAGLEKVVESEDESENAQESSDDAAGESGSESGSEQ